MSIWEFELFGWQWRVDCAIPIFFLLETVVMIAAVCSIKKAKQQGNTQTASGKNWFMEYLHEHIMDAAIGGILYITVFAVYILRINFQIFHNITQLIIDLEYAILLPLLLFCLSILMFKNKLDMLRGVRIALLVIQLIYTYTFFINGAVCLNTVFNWTGVFVFGILFCGIYLFVPDEKWREPRKRLDSPIGDYDALFGVRKHQCKIIVNRILEGKSDKGDSVCIVGEWGTGKTSMAESVISELKKTEECSVDVIRMNITELFSLSSMVEHFTKSLKRILKDNHIYTGFNSSYKSVALALADIVSEKKLSSVFRADQDETYLEQLEKLNTVINNRMHDHLIVVMIDDIERCKKELATNALFLIKEISMIDCCVPLYLCDYEHLKETAEVDDRFLSKFFTVQYMLNTPDLDEEIRHLIDERFPGLQADGFLKSVDQLLGKLRMSDKKDGISQSNDADLEEEQRWYAFQRRFENEIRNSRNLVKILDRYSYYIDKVYVIQAEIDTEEIARFNTYLQEIQSKYQCLVISVMEVLFSSYYFYLSDNPNEFFYHLDSDKDDEYSVEVIQAMIEGLWQETVLNSRDSYTLMRNQDFAFVMLRDVYRLQKLYSSESNEIQQLISNINQNNIDEYRFSDVIVMLNMLDNQKSKSDYFIAYIKQIDLQEHMEDIKEAFAGGELSRLAYYDSVMEVLLERFKSIKDEIAKQINVKHYRLFRANYCDTKLGFLSNMLSIGFGVNNKRKQLPNLELTASAEMRAGAFAEEFSALYDINGIDGFEKLKGVHQQAVSFLKKHKLYTKAEAEQASEELDQMITELRTVDMMEALFGKPEEIKPSMIEDKTAFNDYLNNLIESVGETEINSPKYLQLISSVFQIIHVKFPKNRSIRATARRWVIALGERNKNTGDYAKTHFTETYLLTVSSSAPKSSKRAKKSDNTAKADGEVPLDGKKNS